METLDRIAVQEVFNGFVDKRVLVVGDSILDRHVYGEVIGTSLETPTLKLKHGRTEISYGGAANVVNNILGLGGRVDFITLLGNDQGAEHFRQFKHENLRFHPVIEPGRTTTVKERTWAMRGNTSYKVLQVDYLDNRDISDKSLKEIRDKFMQAVQQSYIVLFVDYKHGMMTPTLMRYLQQCSRRVGKKTIATFQLSQRDIKPEDYAGNYLVCMNAKEAKAIDPAFSPDVEFSELERKLKTHICVTLGNKGSVLYLNGKTYKADAIKVEEKDSCGAGDSFLAALALGDIEKHPIESLYIANAWAGLFVQQIGTTVPKKEDLISMFKNQHG